MLRHPRLHALGQDATPRPPPHVGESSSAQPRRRRRRCAARRTTSAASACCRRRRPPTVARPIAPTASATRICDASSNTTRSNRPGRGREEPGDRVRADQHARHDRGDQVAVLGEQPADLQPAPLLGQLALQFTDLASPDAASKVRGPAPDAGSAAVSGPRTARDAAVNREIARSCAGASNPASPVASRRSAIEAAASPRSKARTASSAGTAPDSSATAGLAERRPRAAARGRRAGRASGAARAARERRRPARSRVACHRASSPSAPAHAASWSGVDRQAASSRPTRVPSRVGPRPRRPVGRRALLEHRAAARRGTPSPPVDRGAGEPQPADCAVDAGRGSVSGFQPAAPAARGSLRPGRPARGPRSAPASSADASAGTGLGLHLAPVEHRSQPVADRDQPLLAAEEARLRGGLRRRRAISASGRSRAAGVATSRLGTERRDDRADTRRRLGAPPCGPGLVEHVELDRGPSISAGQRVELAGRAHRGAAPAPAGRMPAARRTRRRRRPQAAAAAAGRRPRSRRTPTGGRGAGAPGRRRRAAAPARAAPPRTDSGASDHRTARGHGSGRTASPTLSAPVCAPSRATARRRSARAAGWRSGPAARRAERRSSPSAASPCSSTGDGVLQRRPDLRPDHGRLAALVVQVEGRTGPCPTASSRRATTSSAARFSATNSTRLPSATARASRLVMVCDFPVPGGPSSTNVRPATASATARSCEASAGIGQAAASSSRSTERSASATGSSNGSVGECTRWATSGFSATARPSARRGPSRAGTWRTAGSPGPRSPRPGTAARARPARPASPRSAASRSMPAPSSAGSVQAGNVQAVDLAELLQQAVVRGAGAGLVERSSR